MCRLELASTLNNSTTYSYNIASFAPNGDILSANDSVNGNWTYTYDPFNRLVGSNQNGGQAVYSYVYDRFGNRWQQNGPNSMQLTFTGNSPSNPQNNNRMDGYTYDAAGNLLNDGTHEYFYDAENHLIQVDGSSGYCSSGTGTAATACYFYDANGNRVRNTGIPDCNGISGLSGGMGYTFDLSGHRLMEVNTDQSSVSTCAEEIFAGSRHLLHVKGASYYSHTDWLGTERARICVASCGEFPQDNCTSLPFGDALTCATTLNNPYLSSNHFTGKPHDSETGLDNFGARYNSSSFGRFMSPDPLLNSGHPSNPQTWNRYAYTLNNPLNIVDPTGLYNLANNCASDDKKCNKQFQQNSERLKNGVSDLQKAADKEKDPVKKARLEASLKALGTENDGNNVNVSFGALKGDAAGHTDTVYNDKTGGLSFNVTFDPSKISSQNSQAIDAAHEGTHITDISDPRYATGQLSDFSDEYRAYQTSAWAASALGLSSLSFGKNGSYPIWNSSWATIDDKVLTRYIIENYKYSNGQPYKETTPHNPWDN